MKKIGLWTFITVGILSIVRGVFLFLEDKKEDGFSEFYAQLLQALNFEAPAYDVLFFVSGEEKEQKLHGSFSGNLGKIKKKIFLEGSLSRNLSGNRKTQVSSGNAKGLWFFYDEKVYGELENLDIYVGLGNIRNVFWKGFVSNILLKKRFFEFQKGINSVPFLQLKNVFTKQYQIQEVLDFNQLIQNIFSPSQCFSNTMQDFSGSKFCLSKEEKFERRFEDKKFYFQQDFLYDQREGVFFFQNNVLQGQGKWNQILFSFSLQEQKDRREIQLFRKANNGQNIHGEAKFSLKPSLPSKRALHFDPNHYTGLHQYLE